MTTKARRGASTITDDTPALERPAQGGSYVRKPDGTLERVEFTDTTPVATEDAPAADATPAGDAEG